MPNTGRPGVAVARHESGNPRQAMGALFAHDTGNVDSGGDEDAVAFLQSQHKAIAALFAQIRQGQAAAEKAQLFRLIADSLVVYAALEENEFYPAVKERRTKSLLLESLDEHLAIKRILADMLEVSVSAPSFDAKLKALQDEVEHHVREEEHVLFPAVRALFPSDELQDIADAMKDEQRELDGTEPRFDIRNKTRRTAPSL